VGLYSSSWCDGGEEKSILLLLLLPSVSDTTHNTGVEKERRVPGKKKNPRCTHSFHLELNQEPSEFLFKGESGIEQNKKKTKKKN